MKEQIKQKRGTRMKKTLIGYLASSLLATSILFQPVKSNALFFIDDLVGATEYTQILNNLELVAQYEKQVEQYINQFSSFEKMLAKIVKLPDRQWAKFQESVEKMQEIMNRTNKIIYYAKNLDEKFREVHKGYDKFLEEAFTGQLDLNKVYNEMSKEHQQSQLNALKALGSAQEDLTDDEETMKSLQALSQEQLGQLGAIQAANAIAVHQTQQLKKLHQTLIIQSQAQFKALANEQSKEDATRAAIEARQSAYSDPSDDDYDFSF